MKIGLTTQSFMSKIKSNEYKTEDAIQFAQEIGLNWVEVRDPDISFSMDYLKMLKKQADILGITLHYAWDGVDMSRECEMERLHKALQNARIFGNGTMCRIVIAPQLLNDKNGYSKYEFNTICAILDKASKAAEECGITLVYENSHEPLKGDGSQSFGLIEILTELPGIKLTFDPGNILCEHPAKTIPGREEVEDFYSIYADNIPYVHLKCTKENKLQNILIEDGDVNLRYLIRVLKSKAIFCIELPDPQDIELAKRYIKDGYKLVKTLI